MIGAVEPRAMVMLVSNRGTRRSVMEKTLRRAMSNGAGEIGFAERLQPVMRTLDGALVEASSGQVHYRGFIEAAGCALIDVPRWR